MPLLWWWCIIFLLFLKKYVLLWILPILLLVTGMDSSNNNSVEYYIFTSFPLIFCFPFFLSWLFCRILSLLFLLRSFFNFCIAANHGIPLSMWKSLPYFSVDLLCCFYVGFQHLISLLKEPLPMLTRTHSVESLNLILAMNLPKRKVLLLKKLSKFIDCISLQFQIAFHCPNHNKQSREKYYFMFSLLMLTIPTSERMHLIPAVNATHENEKLWSVDHWFGAIFIFRHEWREITPKWIHLGVPHASMLYQQTCYYQMLLWTQLAIIISVLSLKHDKYKTLKILMDSIIFCVCNNFNTGPMK